MSSIILLKDHESAKKGATISVPFLTGKHLIAEGIGKYPEAANLPAPVVTDDDLRKQNEELRKQNAELQSQLNELLAEPPAPAVPANPSVAHTPHAPHTHAPHPKDKK